MNAFATPLGRRLLFFSLYLSEGAPIGYIWLALPTRLRVEGVPLEKITALSALLVLPWTFKFLAAPFVDSLRSARWGRRHFVVAAQTIMGATILATLGLDPASDFETLVSVLFLHACAAATQDVAIDGLCIASTPLEERGRLNGWMQAGMMIGRAMMGGGALVLERYVGATAVVLALVLVTTFSIALVLAARSLEPPPEGGRGERVRTLTKDLRDALREGTTWLGILFALVGGAAFKALEVVFGPFLVDRGYAKDEVGWFSAVPMIACMMLGAVLGGVISDRVGRVKFVAGALFFVVASVCVLAASDLAYGGTRGPHLLALLALSTQLGCLSCAGHRCLHCPPSAALRRVLQVGGWSHQQ